MLFDAMPVSRNISYPILKIGMLVLEKWLPAIGANVFIGTVARIDPVFPRPASRQVDAK
jgi:hypothetical protein